MPSRKLDAILLTATVLFAAACNLGRATPTPPPATTLPATETPAPPLPSPSPSPSQPANWQTYSDPTYGYSVALPPEWEVCTETEHSRLWCAPSAQPGAPGFPAFYVSVTPAGFTNPDASVYNFFSEEVVRSLAALPVGEAYTIDSPIPEFTTYTRLPDIVVDGKTGIVIENTRVWEGGPNTKERRVLTIQEGETYMLGTYYETPAELDVFQGVLATFKFEG